LKPTVFGSKKFNYQYFTKVKGFPENRGAAYAAPLFSGLFWLFRDLLIIDAASGGYLKGLFSLAVILSCAIPDNVLLWFVIIDKQIHISYYMSVIDNGIDNATCDAVLPKRAYIFCC
jgi:hypothetical protein